jgi:hypothetical protein
LDYAKNAYQRLLLGEAMIRVILGAVACCVVLSGCQSTLLSDDRIISNTAGALGVPPADVTISDRRSAGPTNTYYTAHVRGGATYACVINGGGALAFGMTNPPLCNRPAR